MAIAAIAGSIASIPTTPTLPTTGQIGWTGGEAPTGSIPPGDTATADAAPGAQSFGQTLSHAASLDEKLAATIRQLEEAYDNELISQEGH